MIDKVGDKVRESPSDADLAALGWTREEWVERCRREGAKGRANAEVLPGPLAGAFPTEAGREVAGLRMRPLVHYDYVILRRLDSPLYRKVLELGKPESDRQEVAFEDEDGYEMVWQFTRPVKEVAGVLARGRQAVRQAAVEEIGQRLGALEVQELVRLAVENFVAASSTAVGYRTPSGEGGEVFTGPPARGTGSAGG